MIMSMELRVNITRALVLFALLTLTACHKSSLPDSKDAIHPLASWPTGHLQADQITHPDALFEALKRIEVSAPAIDHANPQSEKAWAAFVEQARARVLGSANFIVPVVCGAAREGANAHLSYSARDKNLHVRIRTVTPQMKERAGQVAALLRPYPERILKNKIAAIMGLRVESVELPYEVASSSVTPSEDQLNSDYAELNSIALYGGRILRMENDPGGGAGIDLQERLSRAALQQSEALLEIAQGSTPTGKDGSTVVLEQIEKWSRFPDGFANEGASADMAFAGNPDSVCLLLRLSRPDIAGGHWAHFLPGARASLFGDVGGWYLVNKDDLSVISSREIREK